MSKVDEVYALVAMRELSLLVRVHDLAKAALPGAQDQALLALHEAIVDSLGALLDQLGEHGLQNQALLGLEPAQIDVRGWVRDCASSWAEVQRLRNMGLDSGRSSTATWVTGCFRSAPGTGRTRCGWRPDTTAILRGSIASSRASPPVSPSPNRTQRRRVPLTTPASNPV